MFLKIFSMSQSEQYSRLVEEIARIKPVEADQSCFGGLKLQIFHQVEQRGYKRRARIQLASSISCFVMIFVVTTWNFSWRPVQTGSWLAGQTSQQPQARIRLIYSELAELNGADIGSWEHVEAVLRSREKLQLILKS